MKSGIDLEKIRAWFKEFGKGGRLLGWTDQDRPWIFLKSQNVADLKILSESHFLTAQPLSNALYSPISLYFYRALQEIGRSYAKYRDLQLNCKVYV